MRERLKNFAFDLQRFANFTGGDLAGEEGVTLSELFNSAGKPWIKPSDKSKIGENAYLWERSDAVVNLTPDVANTDRGRELKLVAGKYDTVSNSEGDEAVILKIVSVIDAQKLSDTAIFSKTIGLNKIINPANTIAIGTTGAITFSGKGEKTATKDKSIDEKQEYEVGTVINVNNGKIKDVAAAAGEEITTADTTHATFTNGGWATFANNSFNTVEVFASEDGTAKLKVDSDGDYEKSIVLTIDEFETTAKEGKTAVTVSFDGQAIKSIDVQASDTADIQFSGTKVFGNDIAINKGTINVDNLTSEDGSVATYHLSRYGSDTLDLMGADIKENRNVVVSKTGNANVLIAKDNHEDEDGLINLTTIKIGDTNYRFNDADDVYGNGGIFLVSNNKATGFLFRDSGDGIVVSKGMKNLKLYKLVGSSSNMLAAESDGFSFDLGATQGIAMNLSIESDSNEFAVVQAEDNGFEIEVKDDTTLTIGDAEIHFKLPSTNYQDKDARTSARIKISADGKLESIKAGNKASGGTSEDASFDVGGIEITFKGMNDSDVISEDFAVGGVEFATKSGDFNYSVAGKEGQVSNEVSLDFVNARDEILAFSVDESAGASIDDLKVTLAKTPNPDPDNPKGEVTFAGGTYKYSSAQGNAYLAPNFYSGGLKFVFVDEGDALTIPEGGSAYLEPWFYNRLQYVGAEQELTTLPVIEGEYTIAMTQDTDKKHGTAEFAITTYEANATVMFDEATFTFSDKDGKFFFGQTNDNETVALGFEATSGTVTMNEKAAMYLGQTNDKGKAVFKVDGTATNITAANVEGDELVYTKEDKSLAGLGDESVIVEAGSIEKIYAPLDKGVFIFGTGDNAKVYSAEAGSNKNRAYFTVANGKPSSFTFMTANDELTSNDFSGLTFKDGTVGTSFKAPVITDKDGEGAEATILKTIESIDGKRTECYVINELDLKGKNVEFGDGTKLTFNDANDDTDILFNTAGKLLIVEELDKAGNEVIVSNATGAVRIDDSEVEIIGGGFTFKMLGNNTPALTDFKAGSNIIKLLKGIDVVQTAGGKDGIGRYTIGSGNEFEISGTPKGVDGVEFHINSTDGKDITVTDISDIDGDESVNSAINTGGTKSTFQIITDNDASKITLDSSVIIADATARTKAIKITGNALDNVIFGDTGKDTLYGGSGNDYISSGAGNDKIYGQDGNDTLWGGAGNDTLKGGDGTDVFIYNAGNDVISDYAVGDKIFLGSEIIKTSVKGSDVVLTIGKGTLTVKNAKDTSLTLIDANGKELSTVISDIKTVTYDKNSSAKVTLASDVTIGDASARTKAIKITGNAKNNSVLGGSGKDTLYGADGNDYLVGGAGNDKLYGQNGNDTLWGGAGNDSLKGGEGADLFIYSAGNDVITDYAVGDKISIGSAISKTSIKGADATFTIGKNTLTVKNGKGKELIFIDASGKEQTIIGGAYLATDSSSSNSTLASWREAGDASARTSAIKITGNALNNTILGGSGKDTLYGADGNDYLVGNAGNDKLYGQNGNDTLWGGAGNDTLKGGAGADVFIYNSGEGKKVISDFADDDMLKITGTFSASYNSSAKTIAFKVGSTASAITLKNFTATSFNVNGDIYKISGSKLVKK